MRRTIKIIWGRRKHFCASPAGLEPGRDGAMLGRMRPARAVALWLGALMGCSGASPALRPPPKRAGETIRYRLLIRDNPVSPTDAAHCFSACQSATTPNAYVDCLSAC